MSRNARSFYIEGFGDPLDVDIDVEPLAVRFLDGASLSVIALEAANDVARQFERDGSQKRWQSGRVVKHAIEALGVTADEAWSEYMRGRTDAFARELELMVLSKADEILDDEAPVVAT